MNKGRIEYILKTIENHCKPLKISRINHIKSESLEEFLTKEMFQLLKTHETVYAKRRSYVQCKSNADRSLGDIYQICKYYFPEITPIHVIKVLLKHISDIKNPYFVGHMCYDIRKRVWNVVDVKPSYGLCSTRTFDEYAMKISDYYELVESVESSQVESNGCNHMILAD